MIDYLYLTLMFGISIVALIKKSDMALWLLLIASFGHVVGMSGTGIEHSLIFFCGANLLLMIAAFNGWRSSKLILPMLIGLLASLDVVVGFTHYIYLMNTKELSYVAGLITGIIGYSQLLLVIFLKDSRGVMNDILHDAWDLFYGVMHLDGDNKDHRGDR